MEILGMDEYPGDGGTWCGVFQESSVERAELPATLKRIEYSAFKNCKSLKSIWLPERLEYIGKWCFYEGALESVVLPPSLKLIDDGAFYECRNLKTLEFPEGLEKIGL